MQHLKIILTVIVISVRNNSLLQCSFANFSGQPVLFWMSSYMSLWSNILFNCAVLINLIVAFFYPFVDSVPSKRTHISSLTETVFHRVKNIEIILILVTLELSSHLSALIWTVMLSSAIIVITLPRESGIRTLVASTILRLIFSIGPEPTLWLLGFLTVN